MAKKSKQLTLDTLAPELKELLLAGQSEMDRRAAIKSTKAARRALGLNSGGTPYGKHVGADGRTLEDDPAEQAVIAFVVALRRQRETYPRIVQLCNAQGFRNRRGGVFSVTQIARICAREVPHVKIPRGRPKKSKPKEAA
jgi:hypothetical protein